MQGFVKRFARGLKHRPYLSATFSLGLVIYAVLHFFTPWQWATCLQIGWNIAIWLYLFLTLKMMWRLDSTHILQRAQQQDAGKWAILNVVLIAIVICFISIVVQLSHVPKDQAFLKGFLILLTIGTIFSTWRPTLWRWGSSDPMPMPSAAGKWRTALICSCGQTDGKPPTSGRKFSGRRPF